MSFVLPCVFLCTYNASIKKVGLPLFQFSANVCGTAKSGASRGTAFSLLYTDRKRCPCLSNSIRCSADKNESSTEITESGTLPISCAKREPAVKRVRRTRQRLIRYSPLYSTRTCLYKPSPSLFVSTSRMSASVLWISLRS